MKINKKLKPILFITAPIWIMPFALFMIGSAMYTELSELIDLINKDSAKEEE